MKQLPTRLVVIINVVASTATWITIVTIVEIHRLIIDVCVSK